MSKIIKFPTKSVREWNSIKATIIDTLNETSASEMFKSEIVEKMKIAYDEHDFSYPLSLALPEEYAPVITSGLTEFTTALQSHNSKLMLKRLKLEIELAVAKGL